jgi:DNA polymerase
MNADELAAQLKFFKDIGVETLDASTVGAVSDRAGGPRSAAAPAPSLSAQSASAAARSLNAQSASAAARSLNEGSPLQLEDIRAEIGDCRRCKLAPTRTNIVFGAGNPNAELVFVGEAPGYDEDQQGLPFVGRAGQLLTKIIESINLKREDVYICNVLKCRPPDNRNPEPDEVGSCNPFLRKQLAVIRPKVVCCLGTFAAQTVLQTAAPISKLRGKFFDMDGTRVIATFHPAYLLRSPDKKREVWEDMKQIRAELFRLRS